MSEESKSQKAWWEGWPWWEEGKGGGHWEVARGWGCLIDWWELPGGCWKREVSQLFGGYSKDFW